MWQFATGAHAVEQAHEAASGWRQGAHEASEDGLRGSAYRARRISRSSIDLYGESSASYKSVVDRDTHAETVRRVQIAR